MADLAISNNPKDFNLFPGVCPGWDSTPRYSGGGAACFHGAQPEAYGRWLEAACQNVRQIPNKDEHIVFINAWNEWAEGAHLEPDLHFGYGYLNETRRVLARLRPEPISADTRKSYDEINKEFVYRSSKTRLSIFYRMIRKARNLAAAATQHLTDLLRMQ